MSSPQENYTYKELQHYLGTAQTALQNFRAKYPDLRVETWQPDVATATGVQEELNKLRAKVAANNAYLDDDEIEGMQIGTYSRYDNRVARRNLEFRIANLQERFQQDLHEVICLHEIELKGLYLALSGLSAKFTADRIAEHARLEKWVATQEHYLALYHINQCKQYSAAKKWDLHFIDQREVAPHTTAVYFLFKDGEIVYVGSTRNLHKRLKNHKIVRENYCQDDAGKYRIECVYVEFPTASGAQHAEKKMIALMQPKLNVKGKET